MPESLYTVETPAAETNESPGPTLGTVITVAVAGQITALKWYRPAVAPSNASALPFHLYDAITQDLLRTTTADVSSAAGWWTIPITPVSVTAGQTVIAAVYTASQYSFSAAYFNASARTVGNLTAVQSSLDPAGIGNGRFRSSSNGFPSSTFNGNNYWTDIVYEADSGIPAVTPTGQAIPVSLGAHTASLGLSASPAGQAVPVALGGHSVALGLTAAPSGLAVPVALGQPSVGPAGVMPNGVAIPVSLGQPSVAIGLAASPAGLAIPVAIGQPSVAMASVTPTGLAIPVATGQPVATLGRTASPAGLAIPVATGQPSVLEPDRVDSPNWPIVATTSGRLITASSSQSRVVIS